MKKQIYRSNFVSLIDRLQWCTNISLFTFLNSWRFLLFFLSFVSNLGKVTFREEPRNRSRPKFRQLSRDVSGEVFDIPEEHQVIFAYETLHGKSTLIGAICYKTADSRLTEPDSTFDSDYYHVIAFLFVKGDFQCQGVGRQLLDRAVLSMLSVTRRPIRVQSAERAVAFFEKMGFVQVGQPFESMCGPRLFKFLFNMEKIVK